MGDMADMDADRYAMGDYPEPEDDGSDGPRPGKLTTVRAVTLFVLGDWDRPNEKWTSKTMTLVSLRTGKRFTYKISRPPGDATDRPWNVNLLTGSDNERDYSYIGQIRPRIKAHPEKGEYVETVYFNHTRGSKVAKDAPSWLAFDFMVQTVIKQQRMPTTIEVWHEGKCGRCAQKLSVPRSVELGLGPKCAKDLGVDYCWRNEPLSSP